MPSTLYICYFGVREPLVQTQVIPYLLEIMKDGIEVSLLTFEPGGFETEEEEATVREDLAKKGIDWHWLRYHKRPSAPATAYDVLAGAWYIRKLIKQKRFDVLHVRGHIPAPMAAIARKLSSHKSKLLFDIRGFMPEEYTDAGVWRENGWLYRFVKRIEKWLMREADGFVVLTRKAREILFPETGSTGENRDKRPVEVIPCCVDMRRFATATERSGREMRTRLNVSDRKVIAYVGSFGGWYMTDEMIDLFALAKELDDGSFFLILTQRDRANIEGKLRSKGFEDADFYLGRAEVHEIPLYLSAADITLSFIKACYSKKSSSPTKMAEYLACGVPVIANGGVGDVDKLITENGVGVLVEDFDRESYLKALREVEALGDVRAKCRETAKREFDLEMVGGVRYRRLYARLLEN